MDDRDDIYTRVKELVGTFNTKGIPITPETRFQQDLEWDSLTVLDFVASVEDEFDIMITMNMQAEIETVGQLTQSVRDLVKAK